MLLVRGKQQHFVRLGESDLRRGWRGAGLALPRGLEDPVQGGHRGVLLLQGANEGLQEDPGGGRATAVLLGDASTHFQFFGVS